VRIYSEVRDDSKARAAGVMGEEVGMMNGSGVRCETVWGE